MNIEIDKNIVDEYNAAKNKLGAHEGLTESLEGQIVALQKQTDVAELALQKSIDNMSATTRKLASASDSTALIRHQKKHSELQTNCDVLSGTLEQLESELSQLYDEHNEIREHMKDAKSAIYRAAAELLQVQVEGVAELVNAYFSCYLRSGSRLTL